MSKILLTASFCFAWAPLIAARAEDAVPKAPRVLSEEDAKKISMHLDLIIQQVTASKATKKLSAKTDSLIAGQKAVQEFMKADRRIVACVEYEGWFMFGTVEGDNDRFAFHEGYAVKKGDDAVWHFGFW